MVTRDEGSGAEARSGPQYRSNTTLLGEIAWLMLRAESRREWRVWDFARLIMPAIATQQFRLYYHGTLPIAYVSWALLSPEAETRFLVDPDKLQPEDWRSGDRAYIVDIVAPGGALTKIGFLLRHDPLLRERPIRAIRRRNDALRVIELLPQQRGPPRIAVRPASSSSDELAAAAPAPPLVTPSVA